MANKYLLISTIIFGSLHINIMIQLNLYNIVYIAGILSSLANHGLSNNYIIYSDRLIMIYGILYEIYYKMDTIFLYSAILFYYLGKNMIC